MCCPRSVFILKMLLAAAVDFALRAVAPAYGSDLEMPLALPLRAILGMLLVVKEVGGLDNVEAGERTISPPIR